MTKAFPKSFQQVTLSLYARKISQAHNCLQVWKLHDGKITFTILFSYQQLYCMDFSLGEPERIYNMFL